MEMGERIVEQENRLMTCEEAADILGLSVRRVRQLVLTGKLHATKVGRDWTIWQGDVEAYQKRKLAEKL